MAVGPRSEPLCAQGRRARAAAGERVEEDTAAEEDADFFSRYKRSEDAAAAPAAHMRHVDPTVNLVAEQGDSLAAGFGTGHDPRKVRVPSLRPVCDTL